MGQIVAVVVIWVLSVANYFGVVVGKNIQNVLTILKIGALAGLVIFGFSMAHTSQFEFTIIPEGMTILQIALGFGLALVAVSWAFDGWNNVTMVASEIRNPARNLPMSLILLTLIATVFYLLINFIYLDALPMDEITGVVSIAEKATSAIFGGSTAALISAIVVVSTLGSINGSIIVGPRVYYAMARDGYFFKGLSRVSPRFRTPGIAILFQAIWCSFLTISGTFDQLITFVMFIAIVFWIMAAAAVFTLRKKKPDLPRPYKTWGYPWIPAIFIVASSGILLATLIERPVESLAGIGLTALGVPVYMLWSRRKRQSLDLS
jgi:APA family basic amino acid/polyamine antiporter